MIDGMDRFRQGGKESVRMTPEKESPATGQSILSFSRFAPPKRKQESAKPYLVFLIIICRKLIGARYFNKGYSANVEPLNSSMNSARDYDGHGTHTLSTAAGNFVPGASVYGVGKGTAKGGSPHARVAAYKVCWPSCYDSDIMAAFDMAIHDGVDVVSMSLGGDPSDYFDDGIAIGAFHAVKNNILVVSSAGNSGPSEGSVSNTAPWMFTVGASTMDREFQANVQLKNGTFFEVQFFV